MKVVERCHEQELSRKISVEGSAQETGVDEVVTDAGKSTGQFDGVVMKMLVGKASGQPGDQEHIKDEGWHRQAFRMVADLIWHLF